MIKNKLKKCNSILGKILHLKVTKIYKIVIENTQEYKMIKKKKISINIQENI